MEGVDVFCFGHLLYEMTYGQPPDGVPVSHYPAVPHAAAGQWIPTQDLGLYGGGGWQGLTPRIVACRCVFVCVCVVSVLQSILSPEACKSGMPTVSELLQTP